eukprot:TRINITY_DN37373_c0_g1_i1.p1 TRINITY_DN37373_c0_g1~~TRINITY_DN37373_c0_g1_i1.p1  ORF type:complete len:761 (+),score=76.02 TRINITY_DN37373_c0_g1_i1:80-2362(+)
MEASAKGQALRTGLFRPVQSYFPADREAFVTLRPPEQETDVSPSLKRFAFATDPTLKLIPNFLSGDEVEHVLAIAQSPTAAFVPMCVWRGGDLSRWGSTEALLLRSAETAVIRDIEQRFASVLGVADHQIERLSIIRYSPDSPLRACHDGRYRPQSACVFLNDVGEGGETRFSKLGVQFQPQKGVALIWPNSQVREDGVSDFDWRTLRTEFAPAHGAKYTLQCFVNGAPRYVDNWRPGYEELGCLLQDWWSTYSLGDRSACELNTVALARAYTDSAGTRDSSSRTLRLLSVSSDPYVGLIPDFLETAEIESILAAVDAVQAAAWTPSELMMPVAPATLSAGSCSSEMTSLGAVAPSVAQAISARVAALVGAPEGEAQVENVVVERFSPGAFCYDCHAGPHRAYSVIIYLQDMESADEVDAADSALDMPDRFEQEVDFRHVPLRVKPLRGAALLWSNLCPDGRIDPRCAHSLPPSRSSSPRYRLLCHVMARQVGPFGPASAATGALSEARRWSVLPPATIDRSAQVPVGPDQDFESSEDIFQPCPWLFRGPYEAMLNFITTGGWLKNLPKNPDGILNVNVPFCAAFPECPVLASFLDRNVLRTQGAMGVDILGAEYDDKAEVGRWRQKETYVGRKHPGMRLEMRCMDLSCQELRKCGLAIALHPEATKGDPWPAILSNVLRSVSPGGVCVICTFSIYEVWSVGDTLKSLDIKYAVHENPFWFTHAVPTPGPPPVDPPPLSLEPLAPYCRYIVIARIDDTLA